MGGECPVQEAARHLTSAHPLSVCQPVLSPLEGTKMTVNNLHPRVTEEDIVVSPVACRAFQAPPVPGPRSWAVLRTPFGVCWDPWVQVHT